MHHLVRDQDDGDVLALRAAEEQLHVQLGGDPHPPRPACAGHLPRETPDARDCTGPLHGVAGKGGLLLESGKWLLLESGKCGWYVPGAAGTI